MTAYRTVPLWLVLLTGLVITNLAWLLWDLGRQSNGNAGDNQFELCALNSNKISPWPYLIGEEVSAVGTIETKKGQPIWVKWNLERGNSLDLESLFSQGTKVFEIYRTNGMPAVYNVYFHGPGRSVVWWLNSGGAPTFTEKIT